MWCVPALSEKNSPRSKLTKDYSEQVNEIEFSPEREKAGQRLDSLLQQKFPHHSRSYFQKLIKAGKVSVNQRVARASVTVNYKDQVSILVDDNGSWVDPASIPIEVIYEDDDLVVVNKEAWQIVHPTGETQGGTVLNALHARHNKMKGAKSDLPKVMHRLDMETSGVLLLAKGKNAGYYGQLFENRQTEKYYLTLLEGDVSEAFECHSKLGRHPDHIVTLAQWVTDDGKLAISKFTPLLKLKNLTFCKVKIETGRLHQIRVHAAHKGFPVFGDSLYNPQDEDIIRWTEGKKPKIKDGRPKRQLLHAYQLSFPKINGEVLTLKANLPEDFIEWGGAELVEFWGKYKGK